MNNELKLTDLSECNAIEKSFPAETSMNCFKFSNFVGFANPFCPFIGSIPKAGFEYFPKLKISPFVVNKRV